MWSLDGASAASQPVSRMVAWGGAGGYSDWDTTGGSVRLLFEGGDHIYDWGIKMSHVELA